MDATYLQTFLSDSARKATRSDIRELLKLISRPEIISLAGGLPSPDTFPVEQLAELMPAVLRKYGASALQYGPTEGDVELRRELIRLMARDDLADLDLDRVMVTTASQQALDLCGRVFLAPRDTVVCGLPSYLGALGAFSACGARFCGVQLDDRGMRTDLLEQRLVDLRRRGIRPKLLYVVPDFQNPAGVTLSLQRRHEMLAIAREFDLLVIEDSPYRALRYVGTNPPSLANLDRDGRVISLFTFSKILFPGIRLGWIVGDPEILGSLVTAKQSMDLCTSAFTQVVAREYLKTGKLAALIERTRELYAQRRLAMLAALDEHIDPAWGVRWTRPEGGMFLWVELPRGIDARRLFERALEQHVAFVCGSSFHCDRSGANTLRLNFSFPAVDQIREGVRRLARAIETLMAESGTVRETPPEPARAPVVEGDHVLERLPMNLALTELVV